MALVLQDWIKTVFYADLRQKLVTIVGLALTVVRLVALLLLVFEPTLAAYSWLLIALSVLSALMWVTLARMKFRFQLRPEGRVFATLRHALGSYGIWDHLNRMAVDTLFLFDVAVLSLLNQRTDIASYSIALRLTSLMTLVPRQLSASLMVALSQYRDPEKRGDIAATYIKAGVVLSLLQLAGIFILARPLVIFLFGENIDVDRVTFFTRVLAVAVSVFAFGSPLNGIANATSNVRRSFLMASLPALVFGLASYFVAGYYWGAVGIAYSNIAAYALMVVLLAFVVARYSSFRFQFTWLSPRERQFLRGLMGR